MHKKKKNAKTTIHINKSFAFEVGPVTQISFMS